MQVFGRQKWRQLKQLSKVVAGGVFALDLFLQADIGNLDFGNIPFWMSFLCSSYSKSNTLKDVRAFHWKYVYFWARAISCGNCDYFDHRLIRRIR